MILFIYSIFWDLGVPQSAASILYKNDDACIAMANAQKPTTQTRHMDIKYHVLCKWVERDLLVLSCIVVGRLNMYRTKVLLYRTMVLLANPTKVRR